MAIEPSGRLAQTGADESPSSSGRRRFVAALFLAVLLGNWAPSQQLVFEGGIDPSWRQALTTFIGQKFTFTYGPIGWTIAGTAFSSFQLVVIVLVNVTLATWFAFELLGFFEDVGLQRWSIHLAGLFAILGSVVGTSASSNVEWFPVFVLLLGLRLARREKTGGRLVLLWAVSALALLSKFSFGLVGIFVAVTVTLPRLRSKDKSVMVESAAGLAIFAASLAALEHYAGVMPVLRIAIAHGSQMAIYPEPGWPVLLIPVIGAGIAFAARRGGLSLFQQPVILTCAVLGFLYKQGLSRADRWHSIIWVGFGPLCLVLLWIHMRPRSERTVVRYSAVIVCALIGAGLLTDGGSFAAMTKTVQSKALAVELLSSRSSFRSRNAAFDASNRKDVDGIRALVGSHSISVVPWDYSLLLGRGLTVQPFPVLQTYLLFTPAIDADAADAVFKEGPDFLLYAGLSIDDRAVQADAPRTRQALRCAYRGVADFGESRLLKRVAADEERRCRSTNVKAEHAVCPAGLQRTVTLERIPPGLLQRVGNAVGLAVSFDDGGEVLAGRLTAASFGYPVRIPQTPDGSQLSVGQVISRSARIRSMQCLSPGYIAVPST